MGMRIAKGAGGQQFPVATNALDEQTMGMLNDPTAGVDPGADTSLSLNPMPLFNEWGEGLYNAGQNAVGAVGDFFDSTSMQDPVAREQQAAATQELIAQNQARQAAEMGVNPVGSQVPSYDQMAPAPGEMASDFVAPGAMQQDFAQPGVPMPGQGQQMVPGMPAVSLAGDQQALDQFSKAKNKEADAIARGAEREALAQQQAMQAVSDTESAMADLRKVAQQKIQETSEKLAALNSDISKFEINSPSLLGETVGDKVLATLSIALGSIGSAFTGQKSGVMDILKGHVERAIAKQKQQLAGKQKQAEGAQSALKLAMDRFDDIPTAEAAARAAVYKSLENRIAMIQNVTKSEKAKANAGVAISELQVAQAKENKIIEANQTQQIQSQQFQANKQREVIKNAPQNRLVAAGFAARMMDAEDAFSNLEKAGYSRADITSGLGSSFLPNALRSPEAQQWEQAERNFVNAVLRQESGAAIAPSEFESATKQYFPRAGDSSEVIKQKADNRATAVASLASAGGPENLAMIEQNLGRRPGYYSDRAMVKRQKNALGFKPE